jgi:hypothetical protein
MNKVASLLIALVMFAAVLGSFMGDSVNAMDNGDIYIDPSITGKERVIIAEVMAHIPRDERENVIYIDESGNVYANRQELKNEMNQYKHRKENIYVDKSGKEVVIPEFQSKPKESTTKGIGILTASEPSCTGGTGPYRRVHSKTGYSWMSSYVHLSGGLAEIEMKNVSSGDTGHIYAGGWSNSNTAVDAGFQYSSTYDNWAPFVHTEGSYYNTDVRFKSNQDVFLKFYVPQNDQVGLYVAGFDTTGTKVTRTIVASSSGWTSSGTGNIIKRVTTIAQKKGTENFNTESYIKNVHWYDAKIGTSSTNNHTWSSTDTGGYCSYPNTTTVQVTYVSASEETDNIILK